MIGPVHRKLSENRSLPFVYLFCSAMKNAARGSATTLTPDLNIISPMETDICL